MINKNDAIHTDQWRDLPMDQQMSWYIPLEVMIDIPRLRAKHPILLMSEYLLLQGLDLEMETTSGGWDRSYYHMGLEQPDLFVVPNRVFDPQGVIRVDTYVPSGPIFARDTLNGTDGTGTDGTNVTDSTNSTHPTVIEWAQIVDSRLVNLTETKQKWALDWTDAKIAMGDVMTITNDTIAEQALERAGWVILHTWEGAYVATLSSVNTLLTTKSI